MAILKVIKDHELYLYINGKLAYKKWLDTGQSRVFDIMAYDKYTLASYKDTQSDNLGEFLTVTVKLKLKSTEDGGRKTPIANGYRPDHVFEYKENEPISVFMGDLQFDGEIGPGTEKIITIRFPLHQPIEKYISVGIHWWLHEGARVIGEAVMIK